MAVRLAVYAIPIFPLGNKLVVTTRRGGAIVSESLTDLYCAGFPELLTSKVSDIALAGAVGVPLITPVADPRLRSAGKVPLVSDHV